MLVVLSGAAGRPAWKQYYVQHIQMIVWDAQKQGSAHIIPFVITK